MKIVYCFSPAGFSMEFFRATDYLSDIYLPDYRIMVIFRLDKRDQAVLLVFKCTSHQSCREDKID